MKEITNNNFSYNDYISICTTNNYEQLIGSEFEFEKHKRELVKEQELISTEVFSQSKKNDMSNFLNNLVSMSEDELNKNTKIFHHLNSVFNNLTIEEFKNNLSVGVV